MGTTEYMAPEVINSNGIFIESDMWSLGVMVYQLIFGKLPFRG
jgi:serine/threonine protein kinase